ncbi:DUF6415 family natural product biosynthesis protein [Streptomyces sp. NPDC017979]|uniref:DUF6415 family natural product biosynthesis protein n=1 Tax=Streptomyces sp. NPDC017979 TaxID=3365024 RepID=UPI0037A137B1
MSLVDVTRDVQLAWTVAQALPDKEVALRDRLRTHISVLAAPAEAYARSLPAGGHQHVLLRDIHRAQTAAAEGPGPTPPGEYLIQLAEHVKTLARYAIAERRRHPEQRT